MVSPATATPVHVSRVPQGVSIWNNGQVMRVNKYGFSPFQMHKAVVRINCVGGGGVKLTEREEY